VNDNNILEIRKYIDKNLGNYKFNIPEYSHYEFNIEDFEQPFEIPEDNPDYKYSSDSKAINEGLNYFEVTYYEKHEALRKKVLANYKNKVLFPYIGYKEEAGNYFYDTNRKIEAILSQVHTMAIAVTGNQINLPEDFLKFNKNYDYSACHKVVEIENHLSNKTKGFKAVGDYYNLIDYGISGNKYGYKIEKCIKQFRTDLLNDLKLYVELHVEELVQNAIREYIRVSEQELYDKIEILKRTLRGFLAFGGDPRKDMQDSISALLKDLKKARLKKESFFKKQDDYGKAENIYGKYKSERDATSAGEARIASYKKDCDQYVFTTLPHLLSTAYNTQIKNIVYNFKAEIQNVFDENGTAYPKLEDSIIYDNNTRSSFRLGLSNFKTSDNLLTLPEMNHAIKHFASTSKVKDYTIDLVKPDVVNASVLKTISGYKEGSSYNYTVPLKSIAYTEACKDICEKGYDISEKILSTIVSNIDKVISTLPRETFEKRANKSDFVASK